MPEFLIPRDHLRSLSRSGGLEALGSHEDRPELTGCWLAEDGRTKLGEPFRIDASAAKAEAFKPSGQIKHIDIVSGIAFAGEPDAGAGHLRLSDNRGPLLDLPLHVLRAPGRLQEVTPTQFGPEDARFVYPVFSERFAVEQDFLTAVDSLYHWILGVPPFDEPDVQRAFRIDAYFWSTLAERGHFDTKDIDYDCADPPTSAAIFAGDNVRAKSLLEGLLLRDRYGLVLINSSVRGGAGGVAEYGYPAWVSITACPTEHWQAVALHEIGHSLDLADEYIDPGLASRPPGKEPNYSKSANPTDAGWSTMFTERPFTEQSIFSLERQKSLGTPQGPSVPGKDFVGLFAGARYRTDYFRPSLTCLMRSTGTLRFCNICAQSIRRTITGA